ncbi:MAG: hypothetical protein H6849_02335 [Alphaproteobacteria bacterium]|nr:MAG: hypothetical protein H6849_02335 [Alphaproteobacteria bacterium]
MAVKNLQRNRSSQKSHRLRINTKEKNKQNVRSFIEKGYHERFTAIVLDHTKQEKIFYVSTAIIYYATFSSYGPKETQKNMTQSPHRQKKSPPIRLRMNNYLSFSSIQ